MKMFNEDFKEISERVFDHYKDEHELACNSDIVRWVEMTKDIKLFWYQKILLNSIIKNNEALWRCGRQIGMTTLIKLAVEYLAKDNKLNIGVINHNTYFGVEFYYGLLDSINKNKFQYDNFKPIYDCYIKHIYINDSIVCCFDRHNLYGDIKGYTFDYLFVDDVYDLLPDYLNKLLDLIRDSGVKHVILTGTPNWYNNEIYYKEHVEYYFPTYVNPTYTKEKDDEHKALLNKIQYSEEIKAKKYEEDWIEGLYR